MADSNLIKKIRHEIEYRGQKTMKQFLEKKSDKEKRKQVILNA